MKTKLPEKMINSLLGKTVEEARAFYPRWRIRPVKIDGESLIVTRDLRGDRINVELEDDKITKVVNVG